MAQIVIQVRQILQLAQKVIRDEAPGLLATTRFIDVEGVKHPIIRSHIQHSLSQPVPALKLNIGGVIEIPIRRANHDRRGMDDVSELVAIAAPKAFHISPANKADDVSPVIGIGRAQEFE